MPAAANDNYGMICHAGSLAYPAFVDKCQARPYAKSMQLLAKRLIDFFAAGFALLALWPILLVLAVLVHVRLGSPVLFRQTRIGKHEEPFTMLKFRTMRVGDGPDHERLTQFGSLLRATSLDELPELWNIFVGDMSFIGPRPLLPEYLPHYTARERTRHSMRPGITGLAQVSGRNALGWNNRLEKDAEYVEQFSLKRDAWILWRTVMVVFQREGITAEGHVTMGRLDDERKNAA